MSTKFTVVVSECKTDGREWREVLTSDSPQGAIATALVRIYKNRVYFHTDSGVGPYKDSRGTTFFGQAVGPRGGCVSDRISVRVEPSETP